jgi:hypothetical protein
MRTSTAWSCQSARRRGGVVEHLVEVAPRPWLRDPAGAVGDPRVRHPAVAAELEQLPADEPIAELGLVDHPEAEHPVINAAEGHRMVGGDHLDNGGVDDLELAVGPPYPAGLYGARPVSGVLTAHAATPPSLVALWSSTASASICAAVSGGLWSTSRWM